MRVKIQFGLRHALLALALFGAGAAGVGYYLRTREITRPYLKIDVKPAGTKVFKDGVPIGETPLYVRMPDYFFDVIEEPQRFPNAVLAREFNRTDIWLEDGTRQGTTFYFQAPDLRADEFVQREDGSSKRAVIENCLVGGGRGFSVLGQLKRRTAESVEPGHFSAPLRSSD